MFNGQDRQLNTEISSVDSYWMTESAIFKQREAIQTKLHPNTKQSFLSYYVCTPLLSFIGQMITAMEEKI